MLNDNRQQAVCNITTANATYFAILLAQPGIMRYFGQAHYNLNGTPGFRVVGVIYVTNHGSKAGRIGNLPLQIHPI
ncbi:hypothetical protein ACFLYO_05520 [Chloroflexota bacterium]